MNKEQIEWEDPQNIDTGAHLQEYLESPTWPVPQEDL